MLTLSYISTGEYFVFNVILQPLFAFKKILITFFINLCVCVFLMSQVSKFLSSVHIGMLYYSGHTCVDKVCNLLYIRAVL